jgi:hypothetical protein
MARQENAQPDQDDQGARIFAPKKLMSANEADKVLGIIPTQWKS